MGFRAAGRAEGTIPVPASQCHSCRWLWDLWGFGPRTWALPLVDIGLSISQPQPLCFPQEAAPLFPLLDSFPEDRNLKTNKNQSFW